MTDIPGDDIAPPPLTRKILIDKPGFYPKITSKEYFSEPCPTPALTASGIKTLLNRTPAEFAYEHPAITPDSPEAASSAAKRLGDVCHQLALGKGRGYAVGDFKAWQSADAKHFKATAEANGLTPVKIAEFQAAEKMAALMKARIKDTLRYIGASRNLSEPAGGWPYETEVVIAWIEDTASGPIWMRSMLDVWCEPLLTIIDPKFSERLHENTLPRHISQMGWDIQACAYQRGIGAILPDAHGRVMFANLLVSPKAPNLMRAVKIEEAWRYSAQLEIERAIGLFAGYLRAKQWPGFPPGIETLNAPPWLIAQRMDATMMGDAPFDYDEDGVVDDEG